jgi:hypothetical protein
MVFLVQQIFFIIILEDFDVHLFISKYSWVWQETCSFDFFFMVLGIESSTSFILDKHSTIELYSQPILLIFISYSKKY